MTTSMLLFLVAAACGVLFGVLAVYAQLRMGARLGTVRWGAPAGILAACLAFGGLAFLLDSGVAATTLYEIDAVGSGAEAPASLRFEIGVEHPGARHDLLVAPKTDVDVTEPAQVGVQLLDPAGRLLLEESRTLDPRCEADRFLCTWDTYNREFTPEQAGPHLLIVTVFTPGVPTVHVRVGDEQKTDGVRAPGY